MKLTNWAGSVTPQPKIVLSTLVLACSTGLKTTGSMNFSQSNWNSWRTVSSGGAALLCSGQFSSTQSPAQKQKSSNSPSSSMAASSPSLSLTCMSLFVTSLFQPREMEFDSDCSCHESSRGCIKKASQQCWQEYIYWDCVHFLKAAEGDAGCHRSPWLAGWQAHLISLSLTLDSDTPGWCFRWSLTSELMAAASHYFQSLRLKIMDFCFS